MYANNGKISTRQTFRLYVFDLMGIATLLLPPYLARLCGLAGVWAIGIGSGLGFVYLFYLKWVMDRIDSGMMGYPEGKRGKWCRGLIRLWVGIHSTVTAGFLAYVFTRLIRHSLVQEASYALILLVIIATSLYAVSGGIECRARVYEVLFWLVLIPYVAMVLASVRDFEPAYMTGLWEASRENMVKGIYLVFLLVTPLFYSLFLVRDKGKSYGSMIGSVAAALGVTTILLLGSFVLLVGNFGAASLGTMDFPIVTLMSTIQFEGNFLKRMDALMVAVWFFTLFALLNLHIHYGVKMCQGATAQKEDGRKGATVVEKECGEICKIADTVRKVLPGVAAYAVAFALEYVSGARSLFLDYYAYVAVPLMLVGPLLLVGLGKMNKVRYLCLGILVLCLLTGCARTELETRCFPLLAVVDFKTEQAQVSFCAGFPRADNTGGSTGQTTELQVATVYGRDFLESKTSYEENLNKQADYNHLKVLVIGEALLKEEGQYQQMLTELREREEFPRNTYVCVVSDTTALLEMDEKLPQDIGTYLEEYLGNRASVDGQMLTLGDLLDERENRILKLYLPYIIPEDAYVSWGGYYVLSPQGEIFLQKYE